MASDEPRIRLPDPGIPIPEPPLSTPDTVWRLEDVMLDPSKGHGIGRLVAYANPGAMAIGEPPVETRILVNDRMLEDNPAELAALVELLGSLFDVED